MGNHKVKNTVALILVWIWLTLNIILGMIFLIRIHTHGIWGQVEEVGDDAPIFYPSIVLLIALFIGITWFFIYIWNSTYKKKNKDEKD